ncbi:Uncharacterised protein [Cedecea neteri]|uniref:Uncharacterized protein n=1 Tax=Cedecea neteri TaxID=158822 RepID=A0A2X3L1X0_9ENTR|nr:Uncharacterised protein [Cedecea neteri]
MKPFISAITDSQLPGVLLRDLTQADRMLLLSVLTPQEYPFLAAVLQAPKLWQMKIPADSTRAITEAPTGDFRAILPESKLQQHLWLFTLHYLLVDRGSVFNRQSYMSGLVVRMASAQNQSVDTLLASLISAVDNTAIDSTLRAQLLDLLLTLQLSATSATFSSASTMPEIAEAPAMPDDESSSLSGESPLNDLTELVIALCSGQETQLIQFWPTNRPAFAALLRWCGQLDAVRRHWAETYPEKTLLALVDVLAPRAAFFIQTLLAEKPLFSAFTSAARTERTAHIHLWQFTFAFLIVETRSAFNRRSYLRYLLQQMAAQGNIAYADLLDDMLSHVAGRGGFSPSATALATLLAGLAQTSRPAQPEEISLGYTSSLPPSRLNAFSPAQLNDIGEIVLTLQNANLSQWNHHIEPWQRHYGKQLQPIIRDTGLNASTIKRWVSHFDDPALFTLTTIINPYAKETVRGILNEENIIEKAIRRAPGAIAPTNTRHALWELTLHYLLSRRGSEFNQYQYLLNLTGQLSARYQVKTEILIQEWLSLSDSGFLWRQQLLELVGHQTEIPATGPQLLNNIQSASQPPGISPAQHTLLHRYISINASAVATQLQRWDPPQLERLVRLMQPQVNERVIALLPVLLAIVRRFTLAPHWFYQLLLSGDCPATPEKWFRRLMQQINRQGTSPSSGRYLQLRQLVLNSQDIKFSRADRERWLYSITPEEALLTEIQSWFEGKARVPEQTLFTSLIQTPSGRDYLRRSLANPRYLQRWLEELTPATHQALLFPRFNHATLALLDLRHAFCQLLAAPKQGEYLFWQTLYRQHWLKGITLTSRQLMPALLIELNQAWLAHTNAAPTPQNAPLTGLTTRLLPLIVSASLQKALTQMTHLPVPPPTAGSAVDGTIAPPAAGNQTAH